MGVALEGRGAARGDAEVAQLDVAGALAGPDQRVALGAGGVRRGAPRRPSSSRRRGASRAPCNARYRPRGGAGRGPPPRAMLRRARAPARDDGERSSVGRAPGCGPGGRGFESHRSPLTTAGSRAGVAELAYALGLGPSGATLGGSSPLTRILPRPGHGADRRGHAPRGEPRPTGRGGPRGRGPVVGWSGPSASWAARSGSPGSGPARRRPRSSSSASAARPSCRRCSRARWASWYSEAVAEAGVQSRSTTPSSTSRTSPRRATSPSQARCRCARRPPSATTRGSRSARPTPRCPRARSTQQLDALRERAARLVPVDRPAADGRLPGHRLRRRGRRQAAAQRHRARLPGGARRRPPGARVRRAPARAESAGETVEFPVTYGDTDGRDELRGRTVDYTVTVKQVQEKELPRARRRPGDRRQRVRHPRRAARRRAAAPRRGRPGRRSTSSSGAWSSTPPSPTPRSTSRR